MTQLSLPLPEMHAMSLFCKLDGKMSKWETHCADPGHAINACVEELAGYRGIRGTVLGLIITPQKVDLPVVNTCVD